MASAGDGGRGAATGAGATSSLVCT